MREYEVDYGPDHEDVENDISFSGRVMVLAEVWRRQGELVDRFGRPAEEFLSWNNFILPVCVRLSDGVDIELDEGDVDMVVEAWVDFTHLLDIDHHFPFPSLDACLDAVGNSGY